MSHLPQVVSTTLHEKQSFTSVGGFRDMKYKARYRLDEMGHSTKGAWKRNTETVVAASGFNVFF